jgi:hypothetical protein
MWVRVLRIRWEKCCWRVEYEIGHGLGDGGVVLGLCCWLFIGAGCGHMPLKKLADGFIGSFGLYFWRFILVRITRRHIL